MMRLLLATIVALFAFASPARADWATVEVHRGHTLLSPGHVNFKLTAPELGQNVRAEVWTDRAWLFYDEQSQLVNYMPAELKFSEPLSCSHPGEVIHYWLLAFSSDPTHPTGTTEKVGSYRNPSRVWCNQALRHLEHEKKGV